MERSSPAVRDPSTRASPPMRASPPTERLNAVVMFPPALTCRSTSKTPDSPTILTFSPSKMTLPATERVSAPKTSTWLPKVGVLDGDFRRSQLAVHTKAISGDLAHGQAVDGKITRGRNVACEDG
eukprot:710774-Pleurochrysis_carterae.AAC.1